jgi:hypothetical protein
MRAKRKALAIKQASKSRPAKTTPLPTAPPELNDGIKQEDFSRLENEGGVNSKISDVVEQAESEISRPPPLGLS